MFKTTLPDIGKAHRTTGAPDENTVIYANSSQQYDYPTHRIPYLFVTNFLNKGHYDLNNRRIEIPERSFYFLNANDDLAIHFKKGLPLKTLLILFKEDFIQGVISSSMTSHEGHLEQQLWHRSDNFRLSGVQHRVSPALQVTLDRLLQQRHEDFESTLHSLVSQFLVLDQEVLRTLQKINAIKRETKEELYKRLMIAREFLHDHVCETPTLEQLARHVCLDKFYLLSNFKAVFNTSPHQYLTELKLQQAFQLLKTDHYSVTDACLAVGFESIGSFSNLFKRRFNISPSEAKSR